MKKLMTIRFAALMLLLTFTVSTFAQNATARIRIKTTENGKTSEEYHEVPINDGQDIESILQEMGVLDEFGQLKQGKSFEIDIRRLDGGNETHDINLNFNIPSNPPLPPLPPMSPLMWESPATHGRAFLGVMLKETASEIELISVSSI